jgi:hypothetical protein
MIMLAATTAMRFFLQHLVDALIQSLFQLEDGFLKLTGGQTFVAVGAGGVGLFKPAQRLVDTFATIGAVQGYHFFGAHVIFLPAMVSTGCPTMMSNGNTIAEMGAAFQDRANLKRQVTDPMSHTPVK